MEYYVESEDESMSPQPRDGGDDIWGDSLRGPRPASDDATRVSTDDVWGEQNSHVQQSQPSTEGQQALEKKPSPHTAEQRAGGPSAAERRRSMDPALVETIQGHKFWSQADVIATGLSGQRVEESQYVAYFTSDGSDLALRLAAANALLMQHQRNEDELYTQKQYFYQQLWTLFEALPNNRPLMNAMREQPGLLLSFIKIAENFLFQLFLSFVTFKDRIETKCFKNWQKQLDVCQRDILKLHSSWREPLGELYHMTKKLLDPATWSESKHKVLEKVIDDIKFYILKGTQSAQDREEREKNILSRIVKLTEFQKCALLRYMLLRSQDEHCAEYLVKLLHELSSQARQKKKTDVLLCCAEVFLHIAPDLQDEYDILQDLCSDKRGKQLLSPLLFRKDLLLSKKRVASCILGYGEHVRQIPADTRSILAQYMKTHIAGLLATVGVVLESTVVRISHGTATFKGRRYYRDGQKQSYVTCTASLPVETTHFEDWTLGIRDHVHETIGMMNTLRRDRRSNIVDIMACSECKDSCVCFYAVELNVERPKRLLDVATDPRLEPLQVLMGILSAVRFAHSCGVVLRSLSPTAFYYMNDRNGKKTAIFHDIQFMGKAQNYPEEFRNMLWSAPESLTNFTFSSSSDMYSLGKLMVFVLNGGRHPDCRGQRTDILTILRQNLHGHFLPVLHPSVCEELYLLAVSCLCINPHLRPSIQQLNQSVYQMTQSDRRVFRPNSRPEISVQDIDKHYPGEEVLSRDYCYPMAHSQQCVVADCYSSDAPLVSAHTVQLKVSDRTRRQIITNLDHHYLLHQLEKQLVEEQMVLRLPLKEHMSLAEYARERQPGIKDRMFIYQQIVSAIKYLHERQLVLSVLTPNFVRIDNDMQIVLVHLGRLVRSDAHSISPVKNTAAMCEKTARWSPWETNVFGYVSQASDVAMLGYTVWQVEHIVESTITPLHQTVPFADVIDSKVSVAQAEGYVLSQPADTPDFLYELIQDMIHMHVFHRPHITEVQRRFVLEGQRSRKYREDQCGELSKHIVDTFDTDMTIPLKPGLQLLMDKFRKDLPPSTRPTSIWQPWQAMNDTSTAARPQSKFFLPSPREQSLSEKTPPQPVMRNPPAPCSVQAPPLPPPRDAPALSSDQAPPPPPLRDPPTLSSDQAPKQEAETSHIPSYLDLSSSAEEPLTKLRASTLSHPPSDEIASRQRSGSQPAPHFVSGTSQTLPAGRGAGVMAADGDYVAPTLQASLFRTQYETVD